MNILRRLSGWLARALSDGVRCDRCGQVFDELSIDQGDDGAICGACLTPPVPKPAPADRPRDYPSLDLGSPPLTM